LIGGSQTGQAIESDAALVELEHDLIGPVCG
jgi:hypothetical protein